jgi:hypothetical protein
MKYKIKITQFNSKGSERIIDVKIVDTREEAEAFIKSCKAILREYKPTVKKPDCFYELSAH